MVLVQNTLPWEIDGETNDDSDVEPNDDSFKHINSI